MGNDISQDGNRYLVGTDFFLKLLAERFNYMLMLQRIFRKEVAI